ncbi:MAG: hypothetical protein NXI04_20260 [Planctomycetaceae bacterium]|nr:hypothetical protein [Planctomycetaceae bacterium]
MSALTSPTQLLAVGRRTWLFVLAAASLNVLSGCALPTQACHDCPACQQEQAQQQARERALEQEKRLTEADQKPAPVPETAERLIVPTSASVPSADADSRLLVLEDELRRLQQARRDELTHHKRLQLAVYAMNDRVEQLNAEVDHWQGEVSRLEHEAVAQQNRDLAGMEQLSRMLDELTVTNE